MKTTKKPILATIKQKRAVKATLENLGMKVPKSQGQILAEAGYGPSIVKTPSIITNSRGFRDLLDEYLGDDLLIAKHKQLLNSTGLEHMIFPLGPKGEDDENLSGGRVDNSDDEDEDEKHETAERTSLTDKEIIQMLADVNCRVKRIVHGNSARHVYFWSNDNKALKDGLDMAYKLKGSYAPEKSVSIDLTPKANVSNVDIASIAKKVAEELKEKKLGEKPLIEDAPKSS